MFQFPRSCAMIRLRTGHAAGASADGIGKLIAAGAGI
jgi:hypothetical protein